MANLSDLTRKEQVEGYLRARLNAWVDGPDLANESVGGSEGLKRLRELRADLRAGGIYEIEMRAHPDPSRDIFQYRMTTRSVYPEPAPAAPMQVPNDSSPQVERPPERRNAPDRRSTHLAYDPVTDTYLAVSDAPVPEADPPPLPGQIDMGVPEDHGLKYDRPPSKLELGRSIPCPRCHGIHRAIKEKDPVTNKAMKGGKVLGYEDWTRDPRKPSVPCIRCDGIGLVPA